RLLAAPRNLFAPLAVELLAQRRQATPVVAALPLETLATAAAILDVRRHRHHRGEQREEEHRRQVREQVQTDAEDGGDQRGTERQPGALRLVRRRREHARPFLEWAVDAGRAIERDPPSFVRGRNRVLDRLARLDAQEGAAGLDDLAVREQPFLAGFERDALDGRAVAR